MSQGKKGAKHARPKAKRTNKQKVGFFSKIKTGFLKLSVAKRVVVVILLATILALATAIGTVVGVIIDIKTDYDKRNEQITDPEILDIQPIDEKIINIAMFGIDSRSQNYTGLSDSIMILSVNTETGDIKLISVMRDSLVELPDKDGKSYKPNKINQAYARGGASYAIKTLNKNFELDIKRSITVNFFGMAEIIDAVGGIEVNVLQREINAKNGLNSNIKEQASKLGIENPPLVEEAGTQVLSGIQAVAWARIRSLSTEQGTANDYGRTDRQRIVMEKLLQKVLSMDMNLSQFTSFAKKLIKHMQIHNMDFEEAVSIAFKVISKKGDFEQTRVPQGKYVINDNFYISYAGSTIYYDLDYASQIIHSVLYD